VHSFFKIEVVLANKTIPGVLYLKKRMYLLDLFAGIGGFSLAGHWMEWETVAFVEWDDFCQKVLKKNFPNIPIYGNIKEFNERLRNGTIITDTNRRCNPQSKEQIQAGRDIISNSSPQPARLGRPDIITGGFPCQPFSQAGKRKGTDDSRYLWPEMLETIRILKPPFVIGENVAGLVSMENESPFEKWLFLGVESSNYFRKIYSRHIYRQRQTYILNEIIQDLERKNYTVESFVIPACAVGAWHRRDRIWIIGYSESKRSSHRLQQSYRQGERQSGGTSIEQDVPHTDRTGDRTPRSGTNENGQAKNKGQDGQPQPELSGYSKDVSDTECKRGCSRNTSREYAEDVGKLRGSEKHRYRHTEPGLGGMVDGLSPWLDEPDIPRVARGVKDRVNRLKALGNSIVPQVAFELFKAIDEINNHGKENNIRN